MAHTRWWPFSLQVEKFAELQGGKTTNLALPPLSAAWMTTSRPPVVSRLLSPSPGLPVRWPLTPLPMPSSVPRTTRSQPSSPKPRKSANVYWDSLPNFTCQQVTDRFAGSSRANKWEPIDTLTGRLDYFDHQEEWVFQEYEKDHKKASTAAPILDVAFPASESSAITFADSSGHPQNRKSPGSKTMRSATEPCKSSNIASPKRFESLSPCQFQGGGLRRLSRYGLRR